MATRVEPFSDSRSNIDISEHSVTTIAKVSGDPMRFHVSLTTVNTVIEHPKGISLSSLSGHPSLKLADIALQLFGEASLKSIDRLGFRSWMLIEDPAFTFSKIRTALVSHLGGFESVLRSTFDSTEDVAIVIESKSKDDAFLRVQFGPYQASEREKYFSVDPGVSEALLIDIDVWKRNIQIPNFSLTRSARYHLDLMEKTAVRLLGQFSEVIR